MLSRIKKILLIFLFIIKVKTYTKCSWNSFCSACNRFQTDQCDSCYGWSDGTVLPRALNTSVQPYNCNTLQTLNVPNCKYYKGDTQTTDTIRKVDTCFLCSSNFPVLEFDANNPNIVECKSESNMNTICKTIANCQTTVCYLNSAGISTNGCRQCKSGYYGSGYDTINSSGSSECIKGKIINNCTFTYQSSATENKCFSCTKNYVVVGPDQQKCQTYTKDRNCRILADNDHINCWECYPSYYWGDHKCVLEGSKIRFSLFLQYLIGFITVAQI